MTDVISDTQATPISENNAGSRLSELLARARVEVAKAVVGHDTAVDLMLIAAGAIVPFFVNETTKLLPFEPATTSGASASTEPLSDRATALSH